MASDAPSRPLADDEVAELDARLAALPDDRDAMPADVLDGFLAGVLLAPEPVPPEVWLPHVFDASPGAPPVAGDVADEERTLALVLRRHAELAACLAAREPFDPIVFESVDDAGAPLSGQAGIAALAPWASGLAHALDALPALQAVYDEDAQFAAALSGVLRHLPVDPAAPPEDAADFLLERERLDREVPLADLDDATDELVASVLDAADVSRPRRPVVRGAPKIGRNDPCPCGSGRKFKACHGRADG